MTPSIPSNLPPTKTEHDWSKMRASSRMLKIAAQVASAVKDIFFIIAHVAYPPLALAHFIAPQSLFIQNALRYFQRKAKVEEEQKPPLLLTQQEPTSAPPQVIEATPLEAMAEEDLDFVSFVSIVAWDIFTTTARDSLRGLQMMGIPDAGLISWALELLQDPTLVPPAAELETDIFYDAVETLPQETLHLPEGASFAPLTQSQIIIYHTLLDLYGKNSKVNVNKEKKEIEETTKEFHRQLETKLQEPEFFLQMGIDSLFRVSYLDTEYQDSVCAGKKTLTDLVSLLKEKGGDLSPIIDKWLPSDVVTIMNNKIDYPKLIQCLQEADLTKEEKGNLAAFFYQMIYQRLDDDIVRQWVKGIDNVRKDPEIQKEAKGVFEWMIVSGAPWYVNKDTEKAIKGTSLEAFRDILRKQLSCIIVALAIALKSDTALFKAMTPIVEAIALSSEADIKKMNVIQLAKKFQELAK